GLESNPLTKIAHPAFIRQRHAVAMNRDTLRLLFSGYAIALACGWVMAEFIGGWLAFVLGVWLIGPLCVAALATLPPFCWAFAREEAAWRLSASSTHDLHAWDADLAAEARQRLPKSA
ncbi:MAG: hypothetical protein AAGI34_09550, partial [Pseudomonadota bacterium]